MRADQLKVNHTSNNFLTTSTLFIQDLHSAYGQSSGFHLLASVLKTLTVVRYFISTGISLKF